MSKHVNRHAYLSNSPNVAKRSKTTTYSGDIYVRGRKEIEGKVRPGTHLVSSLCINEACMHAGLGFGHGSEHFIQLLEVRKAHFRGDGRYSRLSPYSAKCFTEIGETGSVTSGNLQHRTTTIPDLIVAQLPLPKVHRFCAFLRFQEDKWYTNDGAGHSQIGFDVIHRINVAFCGMQDVPWCLTVMSRT